MKKDLLEVDELIVRWDELSLNPILHEAKGEAISTLDEQDLGKEPYISLTFDTLQQIYRRVDNGPVAVSFEDILGLTQELAVFLQNLAQNLRLNPDVFEDPLNRGDPLGNVLMISKKMSLRDHRIGLALGAKIQDLCHDAQQVLHRTKQADESWEDVDYHLDSWDNLSSEEILAAKQKIRSLRIENEKLDRRNEALYRRLEKQTNRANRLALFLDYLYRPWRPLYREKIRLLLKETSVKSKKNSDFMSDSGLQDKSQSRKLDSSEEQSLKQTNCLKW